MCQRKRKINGNKETVHKWYALGISGEILKYLKVDVVLEDLIALGKKLKIVDRKSVV